MTSSLLMAAPFSFHGFIRLPARTKLQGELMTRAQSQGPEVSLTNDNRDAIKHVLSKAPEIGEEPTRLSPLLVVDTPGSGEAA